MLTRLTQQQMDEWKSKSTLEHTGRISPVTLENSLCLTCNTLILTNQNIFEIKFIA